MRFFPNSFVALSIVIGLISCTNGKQKASHQSSDDQAVAISDHSSKEHSLPHWSYEKGEEGPENWGNICDEYSACNGTVQSPINIVVDSVLRNTNLMNIVFDYHTTDVKIINNGHTVEFVVQGDNKVQLEGKEYKLLQFHFHAHSEHAVNGDYYPLEVHFVHRYSDTDYAVIGMLFTEGAENKLFKKYLDKFPTSKGEYESNEMIELLTLFPHNKSYYQYGGSLTTPPCSEIVSWYLLTKPVEASKQQIEQFSKILDNNYRPLQALNNRKVEMFVE